MMSLFPPLASTGPFIRPTTTGVEAYSFAAAANIPYHPTPACISPLPELSLPLPGWYKISDVSLVPQRLPAQLTLIVLLNNWTYKVVVVLVSRLFLKEVRLSTWMVEQGKDLVRIGKLRCKT